MFKRDHQNKVLPFRLPVFVIKKYYFLKNNFWSIYLQEKDIKVTLYNTGALIRINSCLTNAQIILN